jgi:hypothetical protein
MNHLQSKQTTTEMVRPEGLGFDVVQWDFNRFAEQTDDYRGWD